MTHDITVGDVQALAARRQHLNARDVCQHFGVGYIRASELLALAARGHVATDSKPSTTEAELMREHHFSATEARAAQRMILNGEIHHG